MKILGYNYELAQRNDLESMGRLWTAKMRIEIQDSLCRQQKVSTVLHEVLEALNEHLQLGLTHPAIMGVESGIYQVLTDNGVDLTPLLTELEQ